jgi:hypothetical protein
MQPPLDFQPFITATDLVIEFQKYSRNLVREG